MFPGQIEFRLHGQGTPVLQYRQIAPTTVRLPTGKPAWGWTEWKAIIEVEPGESHGRKDADEAHANEGPDAAEENADEAGQGKVLLT